MGCKDNLEILRGRCLTAIIVQDRLMVSEEVALYAKRLFFNPRDLATEPYGDAQHVSWSLGKKG